MKVETISVPKGVRYISDWKDFQLPNYPHIMDKSITGCGFTSWIITNPWNSILVSPRIILLENKEEQHSDLVFYARNDLDAILNVDKDLHTIKKSEKEIKKIIEETGFDIKSKTAVLRSQIRDYIEKCLAVGKPIKILVTYDSYRIVYEAIMESKCPEIFNTFYTIVDEFQSIFTDSKFKSDTELEFLSVLRNVQKLCFVSATPMIEDYLEMLDEFKDLPYYELDWAAEDPSRIVKPQLEVHPCQKMIETATKIIKTYQEGDFEKALIKDENGNLKEVESRELVIYVNSVKNICDIIRKAGLKYENTNVLCSGSYDNNLKIRKAFNLGKGQIGGIGRVPLKHEPRKMFTLCTRTVYLGADFYSDNARSIILSDANIDCLAVDITLDLPQILGRQRLLENPWKNRAELYVRFLSKGKVRTEDQFKKYLDLKISKTESLLRSYNNALSMDKHDLAETYQKVTKSYNYRDDFVAVNTHDGSDLVPVFNKLVMLSEKRAFDIQQLDYKDRFSVFNSIFNQGYELDPSMIIVNDFLDKFKSYPYFTDKMRLLCEFDCEDERILSIILSQIPIDYGNYYILLGPDKIKALCYKKGELDKICQKMKESSSDNLKNIIITNFSLSERVTKSDAKTRLQIAFKENNIITSPKATLILDYFEVKKTKVKNSEGKFVDGYELLKLKE